MSYGFNLQPKPTYTYRSFVELLRSSFFYFLLVLSFSKQMAAYYKRHESAAAVGFGAGSAFAAIAALFPRQ